jgi:hypothetical protein
MKLLHWIFQCAVGCHHSHLSRVFTIKKRTYQVCLECGHECEYSWAEMHSLRANVANDDHAPLNGAKHAEVSVG